MGWSGAFFAALRAGTHRPVWRLVVTRNVRDEGVGADLTASTHPHITGDDHRLAMDGWAWGSSAISPQTWSYQGGHFAVPIHLDDPAAIAAACRRGALVRVEMGFVGWGVADYEPIALGRIQGVSCRHRDKALIQCWDVLTALRTRIDQKSDQQSLFLGSAGASATLGAGYTAGSTAAINVGATANKFLHKTGGSGVVLIVGDTGKEFYLTYTGTTATTLTGISATGQFGTHADPGIEDAATSNACYAIGWLNDHPADIARALLTSTGNANNGTYDDYPNAWGYGIAEDWLDDLRFRRVKSIVTPASGSHTWSVLLAEEVTDGTGWLLDLLSRAGMGLCVRQGRISMWAVQDISSLPDYHSTLQITDADIIGQPEVSWYSPAVPYCTTGVRTYSASTDSFAGIAGGCTALPAQAEATIDLTEMIRDNEDEVRPEVSGRLREWFFRIPEEVRVTLAGMGWGYGLGDVVPFSSDRARGRLESTMGGYDEKPAMVIGLAEDWHANTTTVRLAMMPAAYYDDLP